MDNSTPKSFGRIPNKKRADVTGQITTEFTDPPKSPDVARYDELYDIVSPIEHLDLSKEEEYKTLLETVTKPQEETTDAKSIEDRYVKAEALFNRTFMDRAEPEDAAKILKANPELLHSTKVQQTIKAYMDTSLSTGQQYLNAYTSRPYLNEVFDSILTEGSPVPEEIRETAEDKQNTILGIHIQKNLVDNPVGTTDSHNKTRKKLLEKTNQRLTKSGNQEITLHMGVSESKIEGFKRKYRDQYGSQISLPDGYWGASLSLAEQAKDTTLPDKTRKTAKAIAIGMALAQPRAMDSKKRYEATNDQTLMVLFTDLNRPEISAYDRIKQDPETNNLFIKTDGGLDSKPEILMKQNSEALHYADNLNQMKEAKEKAEAEALEKAKEKAEEIVLEEKTLTYEAALNQWKSEQTIKFNPKSDQFPQKDRFALLGMRFGGKVPDLSTAGQNLRKAIESETDPNKKSFLRQIKF